MNDNETENARTDTDTEVKKDDKSSGCGCLLCGFWGIAEITQIILWIVWLVQGRPDTWYGKLFRFQWKLFIGTVVILAGIVVVYFAVSWIKGIWDKIKRQDSKEEHHEEKR